MLPFFRLRLWKNTHLTDWATIEPHFSWSRKPLTSAARHLKSMSFRVDLVGPSNVPEENSKTGDVFADLHQPQKKAVDGNCVGETLVVMLIQIKSTTFSR